MNIDIIETQLSEITAILESTEVLLKDMDEASDSKGNILRLYVVEKLVKESLETIHSVWKDLLTDSKKTIV